MDWLATETGIRVVGLIGRVFILYSLFMMIGSVKSNELPSGYVNPVLALELPRDGAEIDAINKADGGKVREFIRKNVYQDFGYIPLYVLLFSCLSLLLARVSLPPTVWLGWVATACVVTAGILDLIENRGMLKALATASKGASDSLADSIRYPSLGKWALLFIFCLLVGLMFFWQQGGVRLVGVLFLLSALSGLGGVLFNLIKPKFYVMFPIAIGLLALAILSTTFVFLLRPQRLLN
jgi:hypothetical protein